MNVYKQVYDALEAIITGIQSNGSNAFKKFDWYNEQYQNTEQEKATRYPVVYLEIIDPINWNQLGNDVQCANMRAMLHVIHYDVKDSPLELMDLSQLVYSALNRKCLWLPNNDQLSTSMVRYYTELPKRYSQLKVSKIGFEFEVYDYSNIPVTVPTGSAPGLVVQ